MDKCFLQLSLCIGFNSFFQNAFLKLITGYIKIFWYEKNIFKGMREGKK